MLNIKPVLLKGTRVVLEPINESHRQELYNAAQDETIWTYNGTKAFGDKFAGWFNKALQNPQHLTFVVRRLSDQKIMGSTRFYDVYAEHHRLTVGYTWYIPEVWGTYVNPECKYLLLKHAFEDLNVNRLEFVTDSRNARSRAAIKKLGATEEGLLRHHMILDDGLLRDTIVFSIIQSEWPQVKSKLEARLK